MTEQTLPSERFHHLQSLFCEAVALPPEARQSFLEQACAGDAELLAELLGMLHEDGASSLLDQSLPTIAHRVFAATNTFVTPQVGSYRLLSMLGEGGMGVVYLAERSDVGNRVAIKLLRDAGLSPARRERFLSEQTLLAPLVHRSIARFYDAGALEDGTPWFAMEYVEGLPVIEYCHKNHCTLEQRLKLLRDICSAVQYAHEHAVIHRDLKPSNVLVKADGEVKLLDFGIARQLSELGAAHEQTQTLRLLTPAYAAPEQLCGGMVGVFTDIYALGVILYQLLTDRLPFDPMHHSPAEIERLIMQSDPQKPSLQARNPHGVIATRAQWTDLNVLCLTALKKEPQRRYRSAEAFRLDIDNFLGNYPLAARPESTAYRLRKFARRNLRPLLTAATVLAMVIALVAFFLVRLTHSRNEALAQAQRSERIRQFMQHLFDSDGQAGPSVDLRATDVLERGVREANRLAREPATQGDLFEVLGESYDKLGKFDRAASLLLSALNARRAAFGDKSEQAAESLVALGSVLGEQGKYQQALQTVRQGAAIEASLSPANKATWAGSQMILGRVLASSSDYQGAIQTLTPVIPLLSRPDAPPSNLFLAFDSLGTAYFENGQVPLAQSNYEQALALGKRIYSPDSPLVAEEMVNLGSVQFALQNFAAAEKYYRSGLAATEAWYGSRHVLVASESRLLGQALLKEGHNREAEVFLKQALAIHEHELGNLHGDAVQDLNALGMVAEDEGNIRQARTYFNRLLRLEATLPGKDFVAPMALHNLASLERQQKHYRRAEDLESQALKMAAQRIPPTHLYTGAILLGMGKILMDKKQYQQAEPYLARSYAVLNGQGNPSMAVLQDARTVLAADYRALGKTEAAKTLENGTTTVAHR